MDFLKKLFGIKEKETGFIGLSSFQNSSSCYEDEKPSAKKASKKEPTLTELLKRS